MWKTLLIGFPVVFIPIFIYFTFYNNARVYEICGGCQIEYKDLRIGMESDPQNGAAKLWLFVRGKSEENKAITVRELQEYAVDKYHIKVFDIMAGDWDSSTRLQVWKDEN
jgi:hypothetical protein